MEMDVVDGRDISLLGEKDLEYLKHRLTSRKMSALIVRSNVLSDKAFSAAVKAAGALGAAWVIAPLTGPLSALRSRAHEARRAKLKPLFENVGVNSADAAALMKGLRGKAGLAMNPAHFAAAGELPFLRSFKNVRRFVQYLAITDASPLGVPCLPGNGYGEVKELMSVLRCSGFDGCFSLGAAPAAGLEFDRIADAFYGLLDRC